jgi:hypothetical protein
MVVRVCRVENVRWRQNVSQRFPSVVDTNTFQNVMQTAANFDNNKIVYDNRLDRLDYD